MKKINFLILNHKYLTPRLTKKCMPPYNCYKTWHNTEKCQRCPIRETVLFADLKDNDFRLLHFPIDEFELAAGDKLYAPQDNNGFVYTIRSGLVKLVHYLPDGSYRIIRLLHPGDLAGIEVLTGSAYLHHAIALQQVSACRIPTKNIEQLNAHSSHLQTQLTARWHKIQSDADIWLTHLTQGNSKNRVANLLLYLANRSSNESFYLPSREDIGALLAITTETASRVVAEFKRSGLIKTTRNTAQLDRSKL